MLAIECKVARLFKILKRSTRLFRYFHVLRRPDSSTAIIVACLASFRQLFTKQDSRPRKQPAEDTTSFRWHSFWRLKVPFRFFRKTASPVTPKPSAAPIRRPPVPSFLVDPSSQTFSTGIKSPRTAEENLNDEDDGLRASWRRLAARSSPETLSELSLGFHGSTPIPVMDSGQRGTRREKLEHIDR